MFTKTLIAAVAAGFFGAANAHLAMSSPQPIPGSNPKDPLDASGSNFPCHGATTGGTKQPMAAGSSQTLAFDLGNGANTAVHGGGSCQISLTYETDAAKQKDPANWKVIHSFVGGCPSNAMGNLGTAVPCPASDNKCVNSFNFSIPPEVKNGDAILAWTWFNNIGNREMYMNCASVSITGGQDKMDSLPSMFVANLANINTCKTTEQFNTNFPNPGNYVTQASTLNYPLKAPAGNCGSGSGSTGSTGGGSTGTDSGTSGGTGTYSIPAAGAASSAAAAPNNGQYTGVGSAPKATAKASSGSGGAFAEGAGSPAPVATTLVTKASSAAAAGPTAGTGSSPAASPAQSPGSTGSGAIGYSGSCPSGEVACSTPGFYCIDESTYGMCNWGCAVPQQMAAGTSCTAGAVSAKVAQRAPGRFARRHMHHRRAEMSS